MKTLGSKTAHVARQLCRRGLPFAMLAVGLVVLQASECSKDDFYDPFGDLGILTGDIVGMVTLDDDPVSGTTVTVRQGGSIVDTETTDGSGFYRIPGLDPGTYTVSTTISGANCPEQTAVVEENDETEVDIDCTTPEPQTGTVTGTVTVNGTGESGVAVTVREGTTVIATTVTGTGGTYSFTNVATGTKNVSITPPEGATCEDTDQDVTVSGGGTATANFACTRPSGDFTVGLNDPPPGWLHDMPGVSSLECKVIQTSPAQPGASFSATAVGPTEGGASGVLTPQPVTGTLDANGRAQLQVRINRFGTYQNTVTVTVGGITRMATQTITVLPTPNTCPLLPSSMRFKRGVVTLLPDHVRPLGLRPVAFRYREPWGDPTEPQVGLIAEEVALVYPAAVLRDAEGRPDAIDYQALTEAVVAELERGVATGVRLAVSRLAF